MSEELARKVVEAVAGEMARFGFTERHHDLSGRVSIAGAVTKIWNPLRRILGGHGIAAVAVVPDSVGDDVAFKSFFRDVRKEVNSRFVGFAAYKSTHSFVVLICPHDLFVACGKIASRLKDKTGLHMNIIQGVILVDAETHEVAGDYTRPAQHKREYDAVLSATTRAVQ